ncbi:MAG: hypothetical protein Q9187_001188 [Circinaria calcarea]
MTATKISRGTSKPISKKSEHSKDQLIPTSKNVDPTLAALFDSTLGSAKNTSPSPSTPLNIIRSNTSLEISSQGEHKSYNPKGRIARASSSSSEREAVKPGATKNPRDNLPLHLQVRDGKIPFSTTKSTRKRKRKEQEDDVEESYMQRLADEDTKDQLGSQQGLAQKKLNVDGRADSSDGGETENGNVPNLEYEETSAVPDQDEESLLIPQHESFGSSKHVIDLEKASRTVFLANVSTLAIKSKASRRVLLDHLASVFPFMPDHKPAHKVESIRFRSTAFATSSVPKKAAFAKKELMDATTKSTNAYAVYSTPSAAREATKRLNGTKVLDRRLRVDGVAHPAKTDHRRCVFVGNLGFVDDEGTIRAAEDEDSNKKPRKAREPSDIEEGLWRQFSKAGTVENVRVVRDKATRVGKGIAYVQFQSARLLIMTLQDANAVEKALLYNEKKFPPMLPRVLRVTRAKSLRKTASYTNSTRGVKKTPQARGTEVYKPKLSSRVQSLSGRAGKMFGRAGAARLKNYSDDQMAKDSSMTHLKGITKTSESIVFEGYRASSRQSKGTLKSGGPGMSRGKPRTRSSKRGAAFKASGEKKRRT